MNQQDALKLLEISAQLAIEALHVKASTEGNPLTETELKKLFFSCVEMVYEKWEALPTTSKEYKNLEERFATIDEMHRIFAQKFVEYDKKLGTPTRPSRRPG